MPEQRSYFPERFRILSGSGLKVLALFAMLVDHSAIAFSPLLGRYLFTLFSIRFTTYVLLRGFGRIAFPIFCFLLAEGYRHTRDRLRYALGLLAFALISELPYDLFNKGAFSLAHQNVFFTLLLGFLGIWALEHHRDEPGKGTLLALALFGVSLFLKADYSWAGYCFILLTYLVAQYPVAQLFSGVCLLGWPAGVALAYIPIGLYNGKRGFIPAISKKERVPRQF